MCGIAGCIDPEVSLEKLRATIHQMSNAQDHRGPDHAGFWFDQEIGLGHRRLKIIDLSDDANQPMESETCVIIFNGEIYNYVELREELRAEGIQFRTQSDSEIILAAYTQWGTNCTKRFVGMWAFAIWDKTKKILFCSRDRFGIKPFYYTYFGNRFYFASEYRALKLTPLFNSSLNMNQMKRGLLLGWTNYENETYYNCIKTLLPGHNLIVSKNGTQLQQYWKLDEPYHNGHEISDSEKQMQFYNLFKQSLIQHTRSDVPMGACLSGGLDSSSIASLFSMLNPGSRLSTFTIFYTGKGNVDERPFANEVVNKFGSVIKPHFFMPRAKDVQNEFHRIADHSETPLIGSSYMSQYFVMKQAALHGMKVMLDGQGSDEYLAGYMHSFYRWMAQYFLNRDWRMAFNLMHSHHHKHELTLKQLAHSILKGLFMCFQDEQGAFRAQVNLYRRLLIDKNSLKDLIHLPNTSGGKVNNFIYHMLFTTSLPTLLHYEDRFSMAFSIESRVPFLDHRIVEYIYNLAPDHKISHQADTKFILRQSLKRILPKSISQRHDKRAFVTPGETQWLRNELRPLLSIDYKLFDWISIPRLKELISNYERGDNRHASLVWRLGTFNYWLKNFA